MSDERKTDAAVIYGEKPSPPSTENTAPNAEFAATMYDKRGIDLHPAEKQVVTSHHDALANTLGLDRPAREALVREVSEAVRAAGFETLGDYRVFDTIVAGIVNAKVADVRGIEPDEARDQEQYEAIVRELRGTYGDQAEQLLARTNRWLKTQPALLARIQDARLLNDPVLVRNLVAFVRSKDLGRA
jgi:hypothetical protein